MTANNLRQQSREDFGPASTFASINAGSLQRIADATELMAKNYLRLQHDHDWEQRRRVEHEATIARLVRSNNALRGHLKRIKRGAS